MLCLGKLDWLCSRYRVRRRVNNQISHIAHLTQVTHPHRVTWAHSSRVALLHRVTREFWPTLGHHTQIALRATLFMLMLANRIWEAHPWVIRGFSLLLAYPTQGVHPLQVTRGYLHTLPAEPGCKLKFPVALLPNNGLRTQHTSHAHGCFTWFYSQHTFPKNTNLCDT
jgi:hypothetical protein